MIDPAKKWFSGAGIFDPGTGTTAIEPPGTGVGHWAGALSAVFDESGGSFYLYYRVRRPLGEGLAETEEVVAAAPCPVLAAVLESEGSCYKGFSFKVGQHGTRNGKWSDNGSCLYVEKIFSKKAELVRAGELYQCLGKGYRFVFQFRKVEPEKEIITA